MSKLLKEAIADAGLVRETALANAKLALEEAFTPTIQSMLSKKIQNEVEDEEGSEEVSEIEDEEGEEVAVEDEGGEEEVAGDEGGEEEVAPEAELDIPADEAEVSDEEEIAVEDDDEDDDDDDDDEVEGGEGEEDLDLEAILRELEDGLEDDEVTENEGGEIESGVADEEEVTESEDGMEGESEKLDDLKEEEGDDDDSVEEELDLESVLKALSEEDGDDEEVTESEDGMEGESEKLDDLKEELEEYKSAVKQLRSELNEINLLNAKLLFTNKLFKSYDLDNSGKLRVVEMFDRTKNLREIKLVYATLQESFKNAGKVKQIKPITEGLASKSVSSTKSSKSKEIISEGSDFAGRLKKLAGIK